MKPSLIVLAAGMGSRYGGLKQVDPVGPSGEAIIDYSIYDAIRAGFGKVVFVIRESIEEAFKEKFGGKFEDKIEVAYAFQEFESPIEGIDKFPPREKPWGTGHAVLVARQHIQEPFAVINADDYYGVESFQAMADFLQNKCSPSQFAMIGYVLDNTLSDHGSVNRGICTLDENMHLQTVVEHHKIRREEDGVVRFEGEKGRQELNGDALVSMNFWGFHPSIYETIHRLFVDFVHKNVDQPRAEFYIPYVINELISSGKINLNVVPCDAVWYGVTYQEDKPIVQQAFQQLIADGVYSENLWA